jgi:hypothetical protein
MNCIADGFWFKLGSIAAEIAVGGAIFLSITTVYIALAIFLRRRK